MRAVRRSPGEVVFGDLPGLGCVRVRELRRLDTAARIDEYIDPPQFSTKTGWKDKPPATSAFVARLSPGASVFVSQAEHGVGSLGDWDSATNTSFCQPSFPLRDDADWCRDLERIAEAVDRRWVIPHHAVHAVVASVLGCHRDR